MNELIGKYLNGYKIVKVENDPFIKRQINLWTDEIKTEYFGDRSIVKFFIREEDNSSKIYQELIDKEKYILQQKIDKAIEYLAKCNDNDVDTRFYSDKKPRKNILLEILKGEPNDE